MTPTPDDAMPDEIYATKEFHGKWGGKYTTYPVADSLGVRYVRPQPVAADECTAALKWFNKQIESLEDHLKSGGGSLRCDHNKLMKQLTHIETIRRALSQPQPVIPDGYVLVPVEPTEEMLDAAIKDLDQYKIRNVAVRLSVGRAYLLMISAASKEQEKGNE